MSRESSDRRQSNLLPAFGLNFFVEMVPRFEPFGSVRAGQVPLLCQTKTSVDSDPIVGTVCQRSLSRHSQIVTYHIMTWKSAASISFLIDGRMLHHNSPCCIRSSSPFPVPPWCGSCMSYASSEECSTNVLPDAEVGLIHLRTNVVYHLTNCHPAFPTLQGRLAEN